MFLTLARPHAAPFFASGFEGKLETLPKELFDIPTLTELDCSDCGADRPPKNVQEEGVDAMRRWWAPTPEGACVFQGKRPKGPMASWCVKCGKHESEH